MIVFCHDATLHAHVLSVLVPSLLANAAAAGAAGRRFFAAIDRGLSCGCGPGLAVKVNYFLIVVFFYPTLLTPCLCRLSPHQCRNSRSCSPLFAAARRCGCGVVVATTLAFVVAIVMAVAVAIVMAAVDASVAVAGLVSVVSAVPLAAVGVAVCGLSGGRLCS